MMGMLKLGFALLVHLGIGLSISEDLWAQVNSRADPAEVILVDGPEVDLTLEDLKKVLLSVPRDLRGRMLVNPAKIREAINSTYQTKVAAHRAQQKHLEQKPEVQAKIWNRTLNVLAGAEVDDYVAREMGKDVDFEELAREEYLAHQEKYKFPERVEVSHILLRIDDDKNEAEVRTEAERIRSEILSGRISFEEAAKKYSQDKRSGSVGGALGPSPRGRFVESFEKVAFSLDPGKISEPVKTRFGYHLVKVDKYLPAGVRPFEAVKTRLIEQVKKKYQERIRRDYWFQVEGDPRIKVNEGAIEKFIKNPVLY